MPHFIGKTALIETTLLHKVQRLLPRLRANERVPVQERRWLFTGPPGVAKTSLGWLLSSALLDRPATTECFDHISLEHRNGSGVSVDVVREWTAQACYKPMFGDVSVKFIDEIDAISSAALTDIRTYLDTLSNHRVFIATTNKPIRQLQEQLQSRFQIFDFAPVPAADIAAHLMAKFQLDAATARDIAFGAAGNVRAAEQDAQTQLDVRAALPQAIAA